MKIALLCSGLGNVYRGHEIFARGLFDMLKDSIDITLFKGGGEPAPKELVIQNVPRNSTGLQKIHLAVSPRWKVAMEEQERIRIETETFAHAVLLPLLEGEYDVIHCLEQEVCNRLYSFRHLFAKTPKFLFSNGGAIPATKLPNCDFVQEHTEYNLGNSAQDKAFCIPHGVDISRFHPGINSNFRAQHNIPTDAFVVISVGTIGYWHKRMDYVIKEVAQVPEAHLLIVGQECADTPEIKALGEQLMPGRITFTTLSHEELPKAYAAADVFVLGSLFETFGIVYIEAMAMGLPVFCSNHPNQRSIVREGVFLDLSKPGPLRDALKTRDPAHMQTLRLAGPALVAENYALPLLRRRYLDQYARIAQQVSPLPQYDFEAKLKARAHSTIRRLRNLGHRLWPRS